MEHPTDYERAVHYFLEEFAGDPKFLAQSEPDDVPHLIALLTHLASRALGQAVVFDTVKLLHLRAHQFYHGNALIAGRAVLFFYFAEYNLGIAALIPGPRGAMEVARFRLPEGWSDPQQN